MRILFVCLSNLKFNVMTPHSSPLGGTESAIAYLARALEARGHDITVMCNSEETIVASVKHIPVSDDPAVLNALDPDAVVVASSPQAFPALTKLLPRAKCILWNHMRPDQPSMQLMFNEEVQASIDPKHIVYVSNMQRAHFVQRNQNPKSYLGDPAHGTIIGNAIGPMFENMYADAEQIYEAKECRGIYTSTPYRGLACLETVQEIPIDVYSTMDVYQMDGKEFAPMYENLKKNDCLHLHGSVSQTDLAQALRRAAFFVYPSIFPECHSIAILEAMAAGVKIITTDLALEPDPLADILPSAGTTLDDYVKLLRRNVNKFRSNPEGWSVLMWAQVQLVNQKFTWAKRAEEWETYLRTLDVK